MTTINIIEEENLVENAAKIGDYALQCLNQLKAVHPSIGDVRGRGFLIGVELVLDGERKIAGNDLAEDVFYRCLDKGLSFKITMGNVLTLSPPLNLTRKQMDAALDAIDISLGEAEQTLGIS